MFLCLRICDSCPSTCMCCVHTSESVCAGLVGQTASQYWVCCWLHASISRWRCCWQCHVAYKPADVTQRICHYAVLCVPLFVDWMPLGWAACMIQHTAALKGLEDYHDSCHSVACLKKLPTNALKHSLQRQVHATLSCFGPPALRRSPVKKTSMCIQHSPPGTFHYVIPYRKSNEVRPEFEKKIGPRKNWYRAIVSIGSQPGSSTDTQHAADCCWFSLEDASGADFRLPLCCCCCCGCECLAHGLVLPPCSLLAGLAAVPGCLTAAAAASVALDQADL
jgi:hypothetical protein